MKRSAADSRNRFGTCLVAVAWCLGAAFPSFADETTKETKPKPKAEKAAPKAQAPAVAIPPDRETAALDFARLNHPELASLLEGLKQSAPQQYQAALVDLDRTVERLAKVKERSAEKYESEVSEWKLTSRIRLLAARLTMSDDPVIEGELRTALRDRVELRLAAQRAERDRLQARADKLTQTIDETTSREDAIVEKQLADLRKTAPAKSSTRSKAKKPASAPTSEKTQKE